MEFEESVGQDFLKGFNFFFTFKQAAKPAILIN